MTQVLPVSKREFGMETSVGNFWWFTKCVSVVDTNFLLTVKTYNFRYNHQNVEMQGLCVYAEAWRTKTGGSIMS